MQNKIRIVIIDDSSTYRQYLKMIIQEYNPKIEIYEFEDALYFLEKITDTNVDIIITDIEMKYIGGFSLINILLNILHMEIPIILITGKWNNKHGIYMTKKLGQIYLFSKNFEKRYLTNILNNIIYKQNPMKQNKTQKTNITQILTTYIKSLESNLLQKEYLEKLNILNDYILNKDLYIKNLFDIINNFIIVNNIYIIIKEKSKFLIYNYNFSEAQNKYMKLINKILNNNKRNIMFTELKEKPCYSVFTNIKITKEHIKNNQLNSFTYKRKIKKYFSFKIYLEYVPDKHSHFFLESLRFFLANSSLNLLYSLYTAYNTKLDHLTQLYNRNYLYEFLYKAEQEYIEKNINYSLILLDIDLFKKVNDTFGHIAGDIVLKEISQLLTNNVRPFDEVFRFGGEEILIILPSTSLQQTKIITDRILNNIRNHKIYYNNQIIKITVSAGICDRTILKENQKYIDIIKYADDFLYKAKKNGRDQYQAPE